MSRMSHVKNVWSDDPHNTFIISPQKNVHLTPARASHCSSLLTAVSSLSCTLAAGGQPRLGRSDNCTASGRDTVTARRLGLGWHVDSERCEVRDRDWRVCVHVWAPPPRLLARCCWCGGGVVVAHATPQQQHSTAPLAARPSKNNNKTLYVHNHTIAGTRGTAVKLLNDLHQRAPACREESQGHYQVSQWV